MVYISAVNGRDLITKKKINVCKYKKWVVYLKTDDNLNSVQIFISCHTVSVVRK